MSALPTSWADIELSQVAQVTSGIGFPNEYQGHTSGDLPFFKVSDISYAVLANRGELKTANHYVSHEVAEKLKGKPLEPGSTVFAKIGEAVRLNRRATVTTPCLIDNNVMAVKAREGVDDRYVHQFLRTIDFGESARSTTVPSLRKSDVEELRFPLAPAAEQKRIADKLDTVLTRVDAVNTRLARVAPLLKRFRQSVLAAATSGRLTEDWRSDHATNVEWTQTTLGNVIAEMRNGLAAKPDEKPSGSKILRISAIRPGELDSNDHRYLTTTSQESSTYSLKAGDLLFTRYNGSLEFVGVCAMVGQDLTNYVYPDKLIRVRAKPELALPKYLELACSASAARVQIEGFVKSSAGQKGISGADLKSLSLSIPRIDEQTEIVRRVEILFAFADRLEARLAQAQTAATRLTPALLAKAFCGELVPQDPNDEPAAELLRRLQAERATASKASAGRGRKAAASA